MMNGESATSVYQKTKRTTSTEVSFIWADSDISQDIQYRGPRYITLANVGNRNQQSGQLYPHLFTQLTKHRLTVTSPFETHLLNCSAPLDSSVSFSSNPTCDGGGCLTNLLTSFTGLKEGSEIGNDTEGGGVTLNKNKRRYNTMERTRRPSENIIPN